MGLSQGQAGFVPGTILGSSQGQPDQKVHVYVPFFLPKTWRELRGIFRAHKIIEKVKNIGNLEAFFVGKFVTQNHLSRQLRSADVPLKSRSYRPNRLRNREANSTCRKRGYAKGGRSLFSVSVTFW